MIAKQIRLVLSIFLILSSGCMADVSGPEGAAETEVLLFARSATRRTESTSRSGASTKGTRPVFGGPEQSVVAPRRPTDGCNRNVMVGALQSGFSCPEATGGWRGEPLFRVPTSSRDHRTYVVSEWGAGFCAYHFEGRRYSTAGLPWDGDDVGGRSPGQWLDADCDAVTVAGDNPAEDALEALVDDYQSSWRSQMGWVSRLPSIAGAPLAVDVSLIDSSPDLGPSIIEPTTGEMVHGRQVGLAVRDLACPAGTRTLRDGSRDPRCIPLFRSFQAVGDPRRGSIADLARLIEDAVRNGHREAAGRQILSLALGYDPYFATQPSSSDARPYRGATHAVAAALNFATCRGALPIIASGNTVLGPEESRTAAYPAAFAATHAWTCSRSPSTRVGVPIAYGASGLDREGDDLSVARVESRAALAAPAFAVTFDNRVANSDPEPPVLTPGTGTSYGAAGVAGVAALVWGYMPWLDPHEVMEIVYSSGLDLGRPTDFCVHDGSGCPPSRRVNACRALRAAMAGRCSRGSDYVSCIWARYMRCSAPSSPTVDVTDTLMSASEEVLEFPVNVSPPLACGIGMDQDVWGQATGANAADVCPDVLYENGGRLETTGPQPGSDPCGVCFLTVGGSPTMVMGLDPKWEAVLDSATLIVGKEHFMLPPWIVEASLGQHVKLSIPTAVPATYDTKAYLAFQTGANQSVVVPLPLW